MSRDLIIPPGREILVLISCPQKRFHTCFSFFFLSSNSHIEESGFSSMGWVHNAPPEVEAVSQYRQILGVCLGLTILMVITVCLRLWLRAQTGRLGAADYVMVFSMVSSNLELKFHLIFGRMLIASTSCYRYSALSTAHYVSLVSLSSRSDPALYLLKMQNRKSIRTWSTAETTTSPG